MRKLNEEEMNFCLAVDNYDRNNPKHLIGIAAKAQFKQDIKDFIEELNGFQFHDDWGGQSAKGFRDSLVESLKKLQEGN